jgi:HlyD family secretion protein
LRRPQSPDDIPSLIYIKPRATLASHKRRRWRPNGGREAFVAAMRRIAIWAGALILGVAALAAYRYYDVARPWIQANLPVWIGGTPSADVIIVSGNIEAHESVVSFKTVQSRIVELPFDEGARGEGGNRARPRRQVRLRSTSRDRPGDPQRPNEAARRR